MPPKKKSKVAASPLAEYVFAISGNLSVTRNEMKALIEQNGGKLAGSVTKSVTHLITNDTGTGSAKIQKAIASGVEVIDEGFVHSLLSGSGGGAKKTNPKDAGKKEGKAKATSKDTAPLKTKSKVAASPLAEYVFAISGNLSVTRNEMKALIEQNGGKLAGSVTKAVTHLITNDTGTASAKIQKAIASGVEVVDEDFVQSLLSGNGGAKKATAGSKKRKKEEADEDSKKKQAKKNKASKPEVSGTPVKSEEPISSPSAENTTDKRIDVMKEDLGRVSVPKVKAFKVGESSQPAFTDDYEIIANVVLQVTNINNNNNKYYALELHESVPGGRYRLFTHYGRTDDLRASGGNAGQREHRYYDDLQTTKAAYQKIYKEKTRTAKGYQPVNLVSSKIGSAKARGRSAGALGAATQALLTPASAAGAAAGKGKGKAAAAAAAPKKLESLHPKVSDLVQYLYSEATNQLTSQVNCEITANGIETPLGILSIEQVEQGEDVLGQLHEELKKKKPRGAVLQQLSGNFYTAIPHNIGRSRTDISSAVIRDLGELAAKQELCQLMRDMLQVNSRGENVLFYTDRTAEQYEALGCSIDYVPPNSKEFKDMVKEMVESQKRSHGTIRTDAQKITGLYKVRREEEEQRFTKTIDNQVHLYHGSRPSNFVGLLSRGILLPKVVVSMGINRTDGGWLGDGIYFGNADTAFGYAHIGRRQTRLMLINKVALGKMQDYSKITYGIKKPKTGFNSCHGVAGTQFYDDEYVVYDERQQKIQYLVETR